MNDDLPIQNPYNPFSPTLPDGRLTAFVGREAIYARLHQYITDSRGAYALLAVGGASSGKTALLLNAPEIFNENVLPVYIALKEQTITSEGALLRLLYRAISGVLVLRGFTLTRLTPPPEEDELLRDWLSTSGIPEIASIVRSHRHVVLLLDDAEVLLDALEKEHLAPDTAVFLHHLIQNPQLSMMLTLHTDHEARIPLLRPLVDQSSVIQLAALTLDKTADLLRQPVQGLYTLDDGSVTAVYEATGGKPPLVQAFGEQFFAAWQGNPTVTNIQSEMVTLLTPKVLERSKSYFRDQWRRLNSNERLALTALSGTIFDDPLLKPIKAEHLAAWLVKTDYPLDTTTINAAIRALEYADILKLEQGGITLTAGMMTRWLLENARLSEPLEQIQRRRLLLWIGAGSAAAVMLLVLLIALSSTPAPLPENTPQPTVTLIDAAP